MKLKNIICGIMAASCMFVSASAYNFKDVDTNYYATPAITWAVYNNVTAGVDLTHFAPEQTCTRAQYVTMMYRAFGHPNVADCNFTDVQKSHYAYKAVCWAVENGVTYGTSTTNFSPNAPVSRAEAITFVHRLARIQKPCVCPEQHRFVDVPRNTYFAKPVDWAFHHNVTSGINMGHFDPYSALTRAQAVSFIYRYATL